jgi:hypothetical protein
MSIGHNSWLAQPARVIFQSGLSASFEASRERSVRGFTGPATVL